MAEMSQDTQKDVAQLQNLQRQLQMIMMQKQQMEGQVIQSDMTLAELQKAEGKAFKAVGNVLIEVAPKDLVKDLNEKREDFNAKIASLKSQEDKTSKRVEELEKKLEKVLGHDHEGHDHNHDEE